MDVNELVALLGGSSAAARLFGVKPHTVSTWKKRGRLPFDSRIRWKAAQEAAKRGRLYDLTQDTGEEDC